MHYLKPYLTTAALAGTLTALCVAGLPATAQTAVPVTPTTAAPSLTPLVIPAPPGGTVQVEMDIHDDDLLGVFKSFLRGIGQGANAVRTTTTTTPIHPATPSQEAMRVQMLTVLNSADLSDVFKDTTHVHMEVFQVPGGGMGMASDTPVKAIKGKAAVPHTAATTPDQTPFYENAFATEGGQRIIFVNAPGAHVLMTSFGHQHGYAFMVQVPGTIAVMRADGYPDLSKLSALATQVGAMAAQAAIPHALPDSK